MQGDEFIQRMAKGDATVWDELMPLVRKIAMGASRDFKLYDSVKEDVVQDVIIKVFEKWEQYKSDSKLSSWIYSIARNHCLDLLRKDKVRGGDVTSSYSVENDDGQSMMDNMGDSSNTNLEQRLCVQQVLDELESQPVARKGSVRVIDALHWIVENSPTTKELSAYLGSTESAAKERKSYIVKQFRTLCEKFCGHEKCAFNKMEGS